MEKQKARLENWYVGEADMLYGQAYGHPRFKDGESIRTSRVVKLDIKTGKATTINTEYELGSPNPSGPPDELSAA